MQSSWRPRLALLCTRQVLGRALLAAVLVGSLLVSVHQGDAIFTGQITGRVVLKALLTPLIPFCVTLLGALLNSNTAAGVEALRPGWRTVRRSLIIATVVGGTIIAVNQGDVLLAGAAKRKAEVMELIRNMGLRPIDAGPVEVAGHLERMTALLLSINKANKVKESGIKITGI